MLNALRPRAGASIAVFGAGTVGLSAVMAARVAGCTTIIGVDVRAARLELARELGATDVIDAGAADPVEAIKETTGGVGADFSIDATGSPQVLQQAVYCTGPGGVCGLIGAPPFGTEVSLDMNEMLALGRTLRGIVEGESVPDVFVPDADRALAAGPVPDRPDHDLLRLRRDRPRGGRRGAGQGRKAGAADGLRG